MSLEVWIDSEKSEIPMRFSWMLIFYGTQKFQARDAVSPRE
jgi:hypothetical protein